MQAKPRGRPRRVDKRYSSEERLHAIRRMRAEGATLEQIGLRFGLTASAVRYHLIFGLQVQEKRREQEAMRRAKAERASVSNALGEGQ